jgi:TP901 family phage tail tape measure protein
MNVGQALGEAYVLLRADPTQLNRDLDKARQTVEKELNRAGERMQSVGAKMTAVFTVPLVGAGVAAAKSFMSFEGAINKVQAALDPTASQLKQIEAAAIEWGAKTKFSATESAEALGELGKAGFTVEQSITALPATLQMATIAEMSLADAATLTADTLTQFNMRVEDAGKVNDILTVAAQRSTVDVSQLGDALKYAGPVAGAFGMDISATAAALAEFGNAGIKADMAGTALRNILTDIEVPTKGMKDTLKELGIETLKSADGTIKLAEVIDTLRAKGATAGQVMTAFGDRAGPAMVAMVAKGSAGLRELEKDLNNSAGAAEKAANTVMQGFGGAMEEMRGSVETAGVAVGKILAPALTATAKAVGSLADFVTGTVVPAFEALPVPVQATVGGILALTAAAGPAVYVGGTLVRSYRDVADTFAVVRGGVSGLAGAMPGLASAGLIAAKAALVLGVAWASWKVGEKIGEVTGATDWIGKKLAGALYGVSEAQYNATRAAVKGAEAAKTQADASGGVASAIAKVEGELKNATGATNQNTTASGRNAAAKGKQAEADKKAAEEAKRHREELDRLTEQFSGKGIIGQAEQYITVLQRIGGAQRVTAQEARTMGDTMLDALAKLNALGQSGSAQAAKIGAAYVSLQAAPKLDMRTSLLENAGASLTDQITNRNVLGNKPIELPVAVKPSAIAEGPGWASKLFAGFTKDGGNALGQQLGQSVIGAVQGGGSVSKAIGATLGNTVGQQAGSMVGELVSKGISKAVGSTTGKVVGAALGSVVPVFGTIIGGMVGSWVGGMIGKGKREAAETANMREDLIKQAGGLEQLQKRADQAGVSIDKLMDTKKPKEFTKEVEKVNAAFDELKKKEDGIKVAAGGVETYARGVASQLAAGIDTAGASVERLSAITMGTFAGMVKTTGDVVGAFMAMPEAFKTISEASANGAGGEVAAQMSSMFATVRDNEDVFAILSGIGQAFNGLGQAMLIDHKISQAFGSELAAQLKVIAERGGNVNQTMAMMQPQLQKLWEHQAKYKDITDEATLAMLRQAEEQGLVGNAMRDVNEKILDVLLGIGEVLGAQLPSDINRFQTAMDNVRPPTWTIGVEFEVGDVPAPNGGQYGEPSPAPIPLNDGGYADWGSRGTLAVLHNDEAVMPIDRLMQMVDRGGSDNTDLAAAIANMSRPNVTIAPTFQGTLGEEMRGFLRENLIPEIIGVLQDSGALRDGFFNLQAGAGETAT